jgi:LmbE family N-acetylglucosaminyl deacetylase
VNGKLFERHARVMVIAAHPDDESLACAGLLMQAREAGSAVHVTFVTSGENNPWAQRMVERRWDTRDRSGFAQLRREEALAALKVLGVSQEEVEFLGLPDQELTRLLLEGDEEALERIAGAISRWRPTLVAGPSTLDLHPDHSATGMLVELAGSRSAAQGTGFLEYVVHERGEGTRRAAGVVLNLTREQQERKRRAIRCHASQLKFGRRRWLKFAGKTERFIAPEGKSGQTRCERHPVRGAAVNDGHIEIELARRACAGAFGATTLYFVSTQGTNGGRQLAARLPRGRAGLSVSRTIEVMELASGRVVAKAEYVGNGRDGLLAIPHGALGPMDRLFVKPERRFGFFDEGGWRRLPVPGGEGK